MLSRTGLLLVGIIFHVVYLFSIFDIYFKSPLVHGMTPQLNPLPPPADRLVLFVADGLRADKVFEREGQERVPFLRKIMREQGTWGVSHTRVPTESRPGHVAIIAGFYEDVSAVTTGWTMNPVNFDSVFNQSQHTWSFGSPDILPMFQHGASDPNRIKTFMYPPEFEDFSEEASHLDVWVFDKVKELFERAKTNKELDQQLRQKKIVFFLHLLGLDTNGHGFRPHSKEYHDNIRLVDRGIKEITELVDEFYGRDGRTSYIFTADHGMNNRGAHGDGHPDNTRTPLIAWGAGVHPPRTTGTGHDILTMDSDLNDLERNDVLQADIAPLMSSLLGIPIPVNSVGELPTKYLGESDHFKAEAAFANAREILAQVRVKHDEKEKSEVLFRPFEPLSGSDDPDTYVSRIQQEIDDGNFVKAIEMSHELMQVCLRGLRYFQTYDWLFLRSVITAGYIGWCLFCLEFTVRNFVIVRDPAASVSKTTLFMIDALSVAVFAALAGLIWVQSMPAMYYAYVFFPIYFWNQVARNKQSLMTGLRLAVSRGASRFVFWLIAIFIVLEALVYSFFHREILSVCFVLASLWPATVPKRLMKDHAFLLGLWVCSCLCTSIFTLLPVEKGEDVALVVSGGIAGIIAGSVMLHKLQSAKRITGVTAITIQIQLLANLASVVLVYFSSQSLQRREGLPIFNQIVSWAVVVVSTLFPFVYRGPATEDYLARILSICLAFGPFMTLLSISYEMLFYVSFCATILAWLEMERALYGNASKTTSRSLQGGDIRAALFFLFFINVAFFGTGNIASLSSFSLESVYRFVTIFNPFLMGALLIIKILIPFFVVSAVLGVLSSSLDLAPFSIFMVVLSVTDVQTINFFYFVSDFGSWLEIGTSISHFCIAELFITFTIILFLLSRLLVGHLTVSASIAKQKSS